MIEQSADIKEIASALLKFQADVRGVVKDSKNPHFKNKYASLEAVVEAARPGLQAVGIVFLQAPGQSSGGTIEVATMLIHAESGQWMRSTMQIPMAKSDPQGAGSAVTYAQRYSLMAALGIPPVEHLDDDANLAMGFKDTPTVAASGDANIIIAKVMKGAIGLATAPSTLKKWGEDNALEIGKLPVSLQAEVREAFKAKNVELMPARAA